MPIVRYIITIEYSCGVCIGGIQPNLFTDYFKIIFKQFNCHNYSIIYCHNNCVIVTIKHYHNYES